MSYYVKRERRDTQQVGYVGPIRTLAQADREVAAWLESGNHRVWLLESSPEVRAEVRTWERCKPARMAECGHAIPLSHASTWGTDGHEWCSLACMARLQAV